MSVEVHGHRGSRGTHPENTFASFEEAWRVGADWFEIDVRPAADGDIVVFHDPVVAASNARRLDGAPVDGVVPVVSLTRAALDRFDVGFTRGDARFPDQKPALGSRIPSLVDVFRWMSRRPRIGVNVELKADGIAEDDATAEAYCRRVADALAAAPSPERVMLQSFDARLVTILKRRYPQFRTAVLYDHAQDYFAIARDARADGIGPDQTLVGRELAELSRCHDLRLVPWTVNDMDRARELVQWGVHGIITDFPENLRHLLTALRRAPTGSTKAG